MTDNISYLNDFLRALNDVYSHRMNQMVVGTRSEIFLAIATGFIAGMFLATLLFVGFTISCYIYPALLLLNGYALYLGGKTRRKLALEPLIKLSTSPEENKP